MHIAVLVSGGVDSAVSLALLKEQGYKLKAYYLKIWLEDELSYLGSCPWQEDLHYIELICKKFNVPLEVVPLQKEYHETVVSYVLDEIKKGNTPNPDIMCNTFIKFGAFLKAISDNSYDKIATGHYAQTIYERERVSLVCSPDQVKDQTYFLSRLSNQQLDKLIFPIGEFCKEEVRSLACKYDLLNKDRKDSQGICFLGKIRFRQFIAHHVGKKPGNFIEEETGLVIGEHEGFWFYTIGQRQGLGLSGGPWYVVRKSIKENNVFISRNYYSHEKKRDTFMVQNLHWINYKPSYKEDILEVKLRHGPKREWCTLQYQDNKIAKVILKKNDQGIASGQFAVFYKGYQCLGSGEINEV